MAGELGVAGIGMASTLQPDQVQELYSAFQSSCQQVTHADCTKRLCMSDAEDCLRNAMRTAFGGENGENLMCWFHVKAACRKWLFQHASGSGDDKKELWRIISADLDLAHSALSRADFDKRCCMVTAKWEASGVKERTAWVDKNGVEHNFISYFRSYWQQLKPEWHLLQDSPHVPTSNNAAEACVKYARQDGSNRVGTISDSLQFLLDQARFESDRPFSTAADRTPSAEQWRKASEFLPLFGTDMLRTVETDWGKWCVCAGRPQGSSIGTRPSITQGAAQKATRTTAKVLGAEDVAAQDFYAVFQDDFRVFGHWRGSPFCTCPFFARSQRQCHHVLGFEVHRGTLAMPKDLDDLPLAASARGRPSRPGGRYTVQNVASKATASVSAKASQIPKSPQASQVAKKRKSPQASQVPKKPAAKRPTRGKVARSADTRNIEIKVFKKKPKLNSFHLVAELELLAGCTRAHAVKAIGELCKLKPDSYQVRDLDELSEDPRGGLTGFEWTAEDADCIFKDHRVELQVRIRGG